MAAIVLGLIAVLTISDKVRAACHPIEVTWYSPTGVAGCRVFGTGYASWWSGPGVARNDCVYPWTDCEPIRITALATGNSIVITPTMYGDLYTGTQDQRLVDLDPAVLKALGLWSIRGQGLFQVRVEPLSSTPTSKSLLPDTSMLLSAAGR